MALRGIKVIELAGLAPVPFCGMILSDAGARVIKVNNQKSSGLDDVSFIRGKDSIVLNLKDSIHVKAFKRICSSADVVIEPFRPGVMERLSLGPDELLHENPRLIFARITGFGQSESSMKFRAGHDINYLALSGVLSFLRKGSEIPKPPVNLLADFAGGGLMCALGIMMALYEREKSGKGQVIDCSMTSGAAYLSSFLWLSRRMPIWDKRPGYGLLDGGAPNYRCYRTKDNKFVAVGALEPQFYLNLLKGLGLTLEEAPLMETGDEIHEKFQSIFLTKTRDEWSSVFQDTDSCVSPVIEWDEAPSIEVNTTCSTFMKDSDGNICPSPSLKLSSHTDWCVSTKEAKKGENTREILTEHGIDESEIQYITRPQSKL